MSSKHAYSRLAVAALAAAITLGLAGCGGSSNVRPYTPTPPDTTPGGGSSGGGTELQMDSHLTVVHAEEAHAQGYNGQGVVIGIVDSGVNSSHPDLQGRVTQSIVYLDCQVNDCNTDDVVGHGTTVAEVAAGQTFGQWPGGIAPQADIVSARIIQDEEPTDDGSGHGNQIEASDADFFANYLNPWLINAGVNVMNNSWGGLYFNPDHPAQVAVAFADAYRPFVLQHDGLVVFAAGNSSFDDPSDLASLPEWAPDLEQGWIVAVALNTVKPTELASYSDKCGRTMDYCLTAPGNMLVPGAYEGYNGDAGWNIYAWQGTSFAAPEVSGAAAVVWSAFPYFNNDLVRQTLLSTATDLGDPGVDKTFGWGLLNVGKAVKGPAVFAWGDVTAKFDTSTSHWSNDISGSGGLIKDGTGTLVLEGSNTYTGGTTVAGGLLQAMAVLPGDVTVNPAGVAGSDASLDAVPGVSGNIVNAGTVAVRGGDTTVGGNYSQSAMGTLAVNLGSKLDVTGTATLNGGTLKVTGADDGYVANTHTLVLTADGGVTGTFDQLVKAQGVVFTSTSIGYDSDEIWLNTTGLDITQAAAGHGVHYTALTMGSAERVQGAFEQLNVHIASGTLSDVSMGFLHLAGQFQLSPTYKAAQASLESLSGQLHASSTAMTLQAIDATGRTLSRHLDSLANRGPMDKQGMWTSDLRMGGNRARQGYASVGYQLHGWVIGKDVHLGARTLVGFAASQGRGMEQLRGRFDRNRSLHTTGTAYAAWQGQRWYMQGRMGGGRFHQQVDRQLLLGQGYHGVATDYDGYYGVAHGETGLHLDMAALRLTPFASVQYARVTRSSFVEHGAGGFGLKAAGNTVERWQGGVGMKLARQWRFSGGRSISLAARTEWRQTLSASGQVFDASLVGMDSWQPVTGVGLSRQSAVFGLDLTAKTSRHSQFQLGYQYLTGNRGRASVASANFSVEF